MNDNFFLPAVCDHRGTILREVACCGGAVHQSFACSHWTNAMHECVARPVGKEAFRGIQACSECRANTLRPAGVEEAPVRETAPVAGGKFTTIQEWYAARRRK